MRTIAAIAFSVLFLGGCNSLLRRPTAPIHVVYVLDASASIVPASFDQAVKAIESESSQLHRGDCVTVLPILGDSDTIPSDQFVRACVPTGRAAYDQDLKEFHDQFIRRMEVERSALIAHRSRKTDILGSLSIVGQEFALDNSATRESIIIFSDFIEEDGPRDFATSPRLANPEAANKLARILTAGATNDGRNRMSSWAGVRVLLGCLASTELRTLNRSRRETIHRFWIDYFKDLGAEPLLMNDGPGMSANFLAE